MNSNNENDIKVIGADSDFKFLAALLPAQDAAREANAS